MLAQDNKFRGLLQLHLNIVFPIALLTLKLHINRRIHKMFVNLQQFEVPRARLFSFFETLIIEFFQFRTAQDFVGFY